MEVVLACATSIGKAFIGESGAQLLQTEPPERERECYRMQASGAVNGMTMPLTHLGGGVMNRSIRLFGILGATSFIASGAFGVAKPPVVLGGGAGAAKQ